MRFTLIRAFAVCFFCGPSVLFAGKPRPCIPVEQAAQMLNKDICILAHVYDVVKLADGTRFLDVCSPETPDAGCRFMIVSYWEDNREVGDLQNYLGKDVQIRGTIEPMHGRAGMILSRARQFRGGRPKFRPNPMLANGFDAGQAQPPIADPSLQAHSGRRGFMNTRSQETLPAK